MTAGSVRRLLTREESPCPEAVNVIRAHVELRVKVWSGPGILRGQAGADRDRRRMAASVAGLEARYHSLVLVASERPRWEHSPTGWKSRSTWISWHSVSESRAEPRLGRCREERGGPCAARWDPLGLPLEFFCEMEAVQECSSAMIVPRAASCGSITSTAWFRTCRGATTVPELGFSCSEYGDG